MTRRTALGRIAGLATAVCVALVCAAPAAARTPVAQWRFDEGAGAVARDSGPFGLHGTLGSWAGGGPSWIAGVRRTALRFDGEDHVALPDAAALEPARLTVAAWVRRTGSPGAFRYVVSKGGSSCERSSYGLYTGERGGAAFYVAGNGRYTVSAQVAAAAIWDGRWHRLQGSYDGTFVRLYLDGVRVGAPVPGPTHVEYGLPSQAPYIGTYHAGCELPLGGDIDEAGLWNAALTPGEAETDAKPPPQTPETGPIGRPPGAPPVPPFTPGYDDTPPSCISLRVSRRSVPRGRRVRIVATVRRGKTRVRRARVIVRAGALRKTARTNSRGRARFVVRARSRLTVRVLSRVRATCGTPVAYVRVRGR